MRVTVTTGAVDRRMAKPADLLALGAGDFLEESQALLDSVGAFAEGRGGLRYPPWRQAYSLLLPGTDHSQMQLFSKPVESVALGAASGAEVDASTYDLIGNGAGIADRVERLTGWPRKFARGFGLSRTPDAESEVDAWTAETLAGWIMPGQVAAWSSSSAYLAEIASTSYDDPATSEPYDRGSWVRSADPRVGLRFECTTSGTTGNAEPVGFTDPATVAGTVIVDNTATWTARAALELPSDLEQQSIRLAQWLHQSNKSGKCPDAKSPGDLPADITRTFESYR